MGSDSSGPLQPPGNIDSQPPGGIDLGLNILGFTPPAFTKSLKEIPAFAGVEADKIDDETNIENNMGMVENFISFSKKSRLFCCVEGVYLTQRTHREGLYSLLTGRDK